MKKDLYNEFINQIDDNQIKEYLKQQQSMLHTQKYKIIENRDMLVNQTMEKFKRNPDIYDELKYAFFNLKNHDFEADILCFAVEEPVMEQGYTSYDLYHKFGNKISTVDIFELLVSLRENPKETLNFIKCELPKI